MNVLLLLQKEFMKTKISLPAFFFFSLSLSSCFPYLFFLSSPLLCSQCILSPMTNSLVFVLCISSEVIFCFFLSLSSCTLLYFYERCLSIFIYFKIFLPSSVSYCCCIHLTNFCLSNQRK